LKQLNLQQTSLLSDRPQGLITQNFSGLTRFPGEIVDRFVLHLLQAKSFIEVSSAQWELHLKKCSGLKLLTLSYFNHTAGRRFLPFGITAISKWFGDYLSLTTQGVLLCVLKLSLL
jgi:hypothetical protein